MTGKQLKSYIYQHLCQSLEVNEMSIYYEGTKIGNNQKLSDIHLVVGTQLKIIQGKIQIGEVANIIADVHGIDVISLE